MSALWEADALAEAVGAPHGVACTGIAIDTRTLAPGDLFVALSGARDGHDFVADALAKGAAGALVSRAVDADPAKLVVVADVLAALHRLGAAARARMAGQVVAVTGSVGKTTTKEMLRRMLSAFGAVHAAEASFNNEIGVPLTLARMDKNAAFAVLEIGMNHPGEIAPLTRLARPHAAIVTNVERAHIGLMGSAEAIAEEKAAIAQGLGAGGFAILPADSPYLGILTAAIPPGAARLTFGAASLADVRLDRAESDAEGCALTVRVDGRDVTCRLAAPGAHMAMNAAASLAAAHALGLDVAQAAAALAGFAPYAGRGAKRPMPLPQGEAVLLDESYNASTASMRAAFAVLALQPGRHVAVLGDMLELGDEAAPEHAALAGDLGPADIVFTCGTLMRGLYDELPEQKRGAHRDDAKTLAPVVRAALRPGDAVLVKGSYGSRMRDVVSVLEGQA